MVRAATGLARPPAIDTSTHWLSHPKRSVGMYLGIREVPAWWFDYLPRRVPERYTVVRILPPGVLGGLAAEAAGDSCLAGVSDVQESARR